MKDELKNRLFIMNGLEKERKKQVYGEEIRKENIDSNDEHALERKALTVLINVLERSNIELTQEEKANIDEYKQHLERIEDCKMKGKERLNK